MCKVKWSVMLAMLLLIVNLLATPVFAATTVSDFSVNGITATYEYSGDHTVSGNSTSATNDIYMKTNAGTIGTKYITLTFTAAAAGTLKFDYSVTSSGAFKINNSSASTSETDCTYELDEGGTVVIYLQAKSSFISSDKKDGVMTITNVSFEYANSLSVYFNTPTGSGASGVSYTVNDTAVSADNTNISLTDETTMTAVFSKLPSGYAVREWRLSDGTPYTDVSSDLLTVNRPADSITLTPVIEKSGVPIFMVGGTQYYDWETAFKTAGTSGTVILAGNGTLPTTLTGDEVGDYAKMVNGKAVYTIGEGQTLLLPRVAGETEIKGEDADLPYANYALWNEDSRWKMQPSKNRYLLLTIPSGVTVNNNGCMVLGGSIAANIAYFSGATLSQDTTVEGHTHSDIVLNGTLNMGDKSVLSSIGYITGSGTVNATGSGAKIYQPFVVNDYRGGNYVVGAAGKDENVGDYTVDTEVSESEDIIAPFLRYTMQNIQATINMKAGNYMYGYSDLWAGDQHNQTTALIIGDGTNSGLLNLESNATLTAKYQGTNKVNHYDAFKDGNTSDGTRGGYTGWGYDQIGRTRLTITGGASLGSLSMTVKIKNLMMDEEVTVNMSSVTFPVPYNYDIYLNNGEYNVPYSMMLLPGASMTVGTNATLNITGSGNRFMVMDGLFDHTQSGDTSEVSSPYEYTISHTYPKTGELQTAGLSGTAELKLNGGKLVVGSGVKFGGLVQTDGSASSQVTFNGTSGCDIRVGLVGSNTLGYKWAGATTRTIPARLMNGAGEYVEMTAGSVYKAAEDGDNVIDSYTFDLYTTSANKTATEYTEESGKVCDNCATCQLAYGSEAARCVCNIFSDISVSGMWYDYTLTVVEGEISTVYYHLDNKLYTAEGEVTTHTIADGSTAEVTSGSSVEVATESTTLTFSNVALTEDTLVTVTEAAHEHSYTAPTFTWADNNSSCIATYTCDCGHEKEETCTVTMEQTVVTSTLAVTNTFTATTEAGDADVKTLEFTAVAKTNDTYYAAAQTAIDNAVNAGDKVVILSDLTLDAAMTVAAGQNITIDMNGKTITSTAEVVNLASGGTLVLTSGVDGAVLESSLVYTETVKDANAKNYPAVIRSSGTLTVSNVKLLQRSTEARHGIYLAKGTVPYLDNVTIDVGTDDYGFGIWLAGGAEITEIRNIDIDAWRGIYLYTGGSKIGKLGTSGSTVDISSVERTIYVYKNASVDVLGETGSTINITSTESQCIYLASSSDVLEKYGTVAKIGTIGGTTNIVVQAAEKKGIYVASYAEVSEISGDVTITVENTSSAHGIYVYGTNAKVGTIGDLTLNCTGNTGIYVGSNGLIEKIGASDCVTTIIAKYGIDVRATVDNIGTSGKVLINGSYAGVYMYNGTIGTIGNGGTVEVVSMRPIFAPADKTNTITGIYGGTTVICSGSTDQYAVMTERVPVTTIHGGYFYHKSGRDYAIQNPDDQTYDPITHTLSSDTKTVTLSDGSTRNCYYITLAHEHEYPDNASFTWDENDNGGYTVTATLTCNAENCPDGPLSYNGTAEVTSETTAPSCTAEGKTVYTAKVTLNGMEYTDTKEVTLEKLGHSYDAVVTKPACTVGGYTTYTCSACGDTYTADETAATGHTEVVDAAVAATCTETGLTEGKHCFVCGEVIVAQTMVDALGHSYDAVVTAPTCTAGGYTTYTCSACGDTYTADETAATGHTVVVDAAVEATCTATGLTEGKHCSVCSEVLVAQTVVDALGHKYESVVTDPDFNNKGYTTHTCSVCSDSYVDSYVDALQGVAAINGYNYGTLQEAMEAAVSGDTVTLLTDVTVNAEIATISTSAGQAYTAVKIGEGITLDGAGYKLTVTGADAHTWSSGVYMTGGTLKNLTIAGGKRGVLINCPTADVTIDGISVSNSLYALNTNSKGPNGPVKLTVTGSTFNGWSSISNASISEATFTNCTFGKSERGEGLTDYAYFRPYCDTTLTGCTFSDGFEINIGSVDATITADADLNITSGVGGYMVVYEAGAYSLKEIVAKIGDVEYASLADAVTAAESGDTITLLIGGEYSNAIVLGDGVTLDLNGQTIQATVIGTISMNGGTLITAEGYKMAGPDADYYQTSDAVFTVYAPTESQTLGNITIVSGTMTVVPDTWWTGEGQTLTIAESATFEIPEGKTMNVLSTVVVDGTVTIDGTLNLYSTDATVQAAERLKNITTTAGDCVLYTDGKYVVHNHSEANAVVENNVDPTCTKTGSYDSVVYCSVCDAEISRETFTVEATGHTKGEAVTEKEVAADYNSVGSYDSVVYCSVCRTELSRETITVPMLQGVAKVGDINYGTLGEAVVNAKEGETVTLLKDATGAGVVINKDVTIDFGGFTYTVNYAVGSYGTETLGFQILKDNDVVLKNGTIAVVEEPAEGSSEIKVVVMNYANLTVEDLTIDGTGNTQMICALATNNGNVALTGNTNVKVNDGIYAAIDVDGSQAAYGEATMTIETNGTITGNLVTYGSEAGTAITSGTVNGTISVTDSAAMAISGGSFSVKPEAEWCAEGYGPNTTVDENNYYGVHKHEYASVVTAPTCTEQGYTTYTCSKCEDSYVDNYVDALGHTEGTIVVENEVAATCETAGSYDSVVYCSVCGVELSRETVAVPATDHNYESVKTEPTFDAQGYTTHTCSVCGDTYNDSYVAALVAVAQINGQKYVSLGEAVAAAEYGQTIKLLGNFTGAGVVINEDITIDFGGYTYTVNEAVGSYGTETLGFQILKDNNVVLTNGTLTSTTVTEGKEVKVLIQNYANLTLTDMNLVGTNKNILYGLSNNSGEIALNGATSIEVHENAVAFDVYDYSAAGYTVPTMTVNTTGKITGKIEVSETATLAISNGSFSVKPEADWCAEGYGPNTTGDENGYYGVHKHVEGEEVVENEKAADCTNAGCYDNVVYCTVCDAELSRETVVVDALGHTDGEVVVENKVDATCTVDGSYDEVVYCTVCDAEVSRETVVVPASGHTNGDVVVEKEVAATCTVDGSYDEVVYCSVCGAETKRETTTVEALGHSAGEVVVENEVAATCTADGSYDNVIYCTVCDAELSREAVTVPATGHAYEGVVTTEPTCTEKGVKTYTCKNDASHTYTEEVAALGHNDVDKNHVCDNGCSEGQGTHEAAEGKHTCDYCGKALEECSDVTTDTDHNCDVCGDKLSDCADNDKNHKCDICGTELSRCADSNNDHKCDVCGDKLSDCADSNNDHKCDVCGDKLSDCADNDKNHKCDVCGDELTKCADGNNDHNCDVCGAELSKCADGNNDHNCDVCGAELSKCADSNNDHKCDTCGVELTSCADDDSDHKCDVCGDKLSDCADSNNDHNCDTCGYTMSVCGESTVEYRGNTIKYNDTDAAALKITTFIQRIGVEELMQKINNCTTIVKDNAGEDGFAANVYAESEYTDFLYSIAGAEWLTEHTDDMDTIKANAAVLYVAKLVEDDRVDLSVLTAENGAATIDANRSTEPGKAFAQMAMAYGMYNAYAYDCCIEEVLANSEEPAKILTHMNTDAYREYVGSEKGQTDLEGFKVALRVLIDCADNTDAVHTLLLNGFSDTELVTAISEAMSEVKHECKSCGDELSKCEESPKGVAYERVEGTETHIESEFCLVCDVVTTSDPVDCADDDGDSKCDDCGGSIASKDVIYGDVTEDNSITMQDVSSILKYINGGTFTDEQITAADVSGDGSVTMNDVSSILKFINGTIDKFPVEENKTA